MPHEIESELLVRYFSGNASPEEHAYIEAWLGDDPARKELLRSLEQLWRASGERPLRWNVDDAWIKTARRTGETAKEKRPDRVQPVMRSRLAEERPAPGGRRTREPTTRQASRSSLFGRVVAVLSVIAIGTFLLSYALHEPVSALIEAPARVYATEAGQRSTIRLPDGSLVKLNVASTLTVPAAFGSSDRAVRIEGEAYFEVERDASLPFIVQTERSVVEVIGTTFIISDYPDEAVHVAVAEGTVAVHGTAEALADTAILRARDLVLFHGNLWQVSRGAANFERYLAWLEGRLVFESAPFDEVARQLERLYGLEIVSTVPPSEVDRLNASFSDEPLSEILNIVAGALDLEYERVQNRVTFFPAGSRNP